MPRLRSDERQVGLLNELCLEFHRTARFPPFFFTLPVHVYVSFLVDMPVNLQHMYIPTPPLSGLQAGSADEQLVTTWAAI